MERITRENLPESMQYMKLHDTIQVDVDVGKDPDTGDVKKKSYLIIKKELEGRPVFIIAFGGEYEIVRTELDVMEFIERDIKRGARSVDDKKERNDAAPIIRELLGADTPAWGTLEDRIIDYLLTTYIRNISNFEREVLVTTPAIRGMHGVHHDTTAEMVGRAIENLMKEEIIIVGKKEESGYAVKWHPVFQSQLRRLRDEKYGRDEAG